MNFNVHYNSAINIIEVETHGFGSRNEIIEMLRRIIELCVENPTANILVDHSDIDGGQLTIDDLSDISHHFEKAQSIMKNRKIAHIAATNLQFGLIRMWEILVERAGVSDVPLMVFRDKESGLEWVQSHC